MAPLVLQYRARYHCATQEAPIILDVILKSKYLNSVLYCNVVLMLIVFGPGTTDETLLMADYQPLTVGINR